MVLCGRGPPREGQELFFWAKDEVFHDYEEFTREFIEMFGRTEVSANEELLLKIQNMKLELRKLEEQLLEVYPIQRKAGIPLKDIIAARLPREKRTALRAERT